jgi:sugar-specific transcriptional regulator TrmB
MSLDFTNTLSQMGISSDQAVLYQTLLQNGPQTALNLAKITPVKRTYIYKLMDQLVEKGLVIMESKGHSTKFRTASPDKLLELVENQKILANQAAQALENALPTLKSLYTISEEKPIVSYYEGLEGVKKVYLDTISQRKPISSFLQNSEINQNLRDWLRTVYLDRRIQAGIEAKVIIASGERAQQYQQESFANLRQVKVVDSQAYPFQVEVNIYGSKVAYMNFNQEKLIGVIIENQGIATTMQAFFNLTWTLIP